MKCMRVGEKMKEHNQLEIYSDRETRRLRERWRGGKSIVCGCMWSSAFARNTHSADTELCAFVLRTADQSQCHDDVSPVLFRTCPVRCVCVVVLDRFYHYSAILRSRADSPRSHVILHE